MLKSRWSLVLALSLYCAREGSAIELRCIGDQVPDSPGHARHILGGMTAGAISNLYHSEDERGARLTFENSGLGIGFTAAGNLVREFVLRKITHDVPEFEQGQKAELAAK